MSSGGGSQAEWFAGRLQEAYECQVQVLGPDKDDETQVEVLNRIIT